MVVVVVDYFCHPSSSVADDGVDDSYGWMLARTHTTKTNNDT
jgi:hypothetical protein